LVVTNHFVFEAGLELALDATGERAIVAAMNDSILQNNGRPPMNAAIR
jgi:hypothetical protein